MGRCALRLTPLAVVMAIAGCTTPPARTYDSVVTVVTVPGCTPSAVDSLRVTALGDFAAGDDTVEVLGAGDALTIDRFPVATRALSILAEGPGFEGGGVAAVTTLGAPANVLLLPLGASCALGDSEARTFAQGLVAAAPTGVLMAGGLDGDVASRRAAFLPVGSTLVTLVGEGMANRRLGATATPVGDRIVIAGGAAAEDGAADDTFEVFDALSQSFVITGSLCGTTAGCVGRRDHGAAVTASGDVLLVGGVASGDGAPMDDAVLVKAAGEVDRDVGKLPAGRRAPAALALDDGTVLVVGGVGKGGAETGTVYVFDDAARAFDDALNAKGDKLTLAPRAGGAAVALPGASFAWIGGVILGDGSRSMTHCLRLSPDEGAVRFACDVRDDVLPVVLTSLRAVAITGGRILVTGRAGGEPRAFVVDPSGAAATVAAPASRTPLGLTAMADGTVAEVGTDGTSLRRPDLRTIFDAPPNSYLPGGAEDLDLDAVDHWDTAGGVLRAKVDDARLLVPDLRFARFAVTLSADPGTDLLLLGDGTPPVVVQITQTDVAFGLCRVPWHDGDVLTVSRDGADLTLATAEDTVTCAAPELAPRVAVGVRALTDVTIRALAVARR